MKGVWQAPEPAATQITEMTAADLAAAYRSRALSPREAAAAYLDRITAVDPEVNAFCLVCPDEAASQAEAAESRFMAAAPLGPLDGVPVAVKDLLLTRGWPTRRGSRLIKAEQMWPDDAPTVARLRAGGAVFLGKTTTPELGWKAVTDSPLQGITRNPWQLECGAGGSSGGSAAAIAAGMTPLALGTDGGGSIRIPAGWCGVVGLKPSRGRVAQWPASPFGVLAHTGPMSWTVRDAATLLAVIAGPDPADPDALPPSGVDYASPAHMGMRGVRIAFSPALGYVPVDPEVAASVATAAIVFASLGADVAEADPGFADPLGIFEVLWYAGAAKALQAYPPEQRADMDPGLVEIAEAGARYSAVEYLEALGERNALARRMNRFHQAYDLLITPALPRPAFTAGREVPEAWPERRWMTWTPFTYPFNLTGQPAISVPCGFTRAGLPIGLQIVGPPGRDDLVLAAAASYQQAAPLTRRRPRLPPGRRAAAASGQLPAARPRLAE
jgi:aspartyl-tRNA(Asn)/glutamyl-tRNA(Gln) amidotransferase subunit A